VPLDPFAAALDDLEQERRQRPVTQTRSPFEQSAIEVLDAQRKAREMRLKAGVEDQPDVSPDRAKEILELSNQLGVPSDVVRRNFDAFKAELSAFGAPYQQVVEQSPVLAEFASEPENAALIKDDLAELGLIEWMLTAPGRSFAQSVAQMRHAEIRTASLYRDLTEREQIDLRTQKIHSQLGGSLGVGDSWFREAVTGGSALLANVLFGVKEAGVFGAAGAVVGGVAGGAAGAAAGGVGAVPGALKGASTGLRVGALVGGAKFGFELEAGLAYDEMLEFTDPVTGEKIDPNVARAAAFGAGVINAGLEVAGLKILAKSIPGFDKLKGAVTRDAVKQALRNPSVRSALGGVLRDYGTVLTSETAIEVGQRAATIMATELAKAGTSTDITLRSGEDIVTDLAREARGAAMGFIFIAAPGPALSIPRSLRAVEQSRTDQAVLQALSEGAEQSKTIERLPAKAQEFVARATQDGPIETLYIDPKAWKAAMEAKGLDPAAVAAEVTGSTTLYQESLDSSADMPISTAAYTVKLAATEHHAALAPDIRLGSPEKMTAREEQAFVEKLKANREAAAEQAEADAQVAQEKVDAPAPANLEAQPAVERREVRRIAAELSQFAEQQTVDTEVTARETAAPVLSAINGESSRTSQEVLTEVQAYLEGGAVTPAVADVIRVARERAYVDPEAHQPILPREAGEVAGEVYDDAVGPKVDTSAIRETLIEKLRQAGVTDRAVAEEEATFIEQFFATQGQRLGVDPVAAAEGRFELTVSRPDLADVAVAEGETELGQGPVGPQLPQLVVAPAKVAGGRVSVSTRRPSAKDARPQDDVLRTDAEVVYSQPAFLKTVADLVRAMPHVTAQEAALGDKEVTEVLIGRMVRNLRWLWDQTPKKIRERARRWYVGAMDLTNRLAKDSGFAFEQTVAVMASQSPQKDWFQNVSLAERVVSLFQQLEDSNQVFTKALFDHYEQRSIEAIAERERQIKNKAGPKAAARYRAKKIAALKAERPVLVGQTWGKLNLNGQAKLLRAVDETQNSSAYRIITPEGRRVGWARKKNGARSSVTWGGYKTIENGISVLRDGSVSNIENRLGTKHKVRSFFNNISNPWDADSVTIDTHAVGAALLEPLGASAPEVHAVMNGPSNADTGITGMNPIYAEAYFRLAKELKILPRELQSVVWETQRGLYLPEQRRGPLVGEVRGLWDAFRDGKISEEQLRGQLVSRADGIRRPSWVSGGGRVAYDEGRIRRRTLGRGRGRVPAGRGASGRGARLSARANPKLADGFALPPEVNERLQRSAEKLARLQRKLAGYTRLVRSRRSSQEGVSRLNRREAVGDDRRLRVRGLTEKQITAVFDPTPGWAADLASVGFESPSFYQLDTSRESARAFHEAISESKKTVPFSAAVFVYTKTQYRGFRLYLTEDGKNGFAIKPDGDVVSAFSSGGGKSHNMLQIAIDEGGTKLDAFDTVLPILYGANGFVEDRREAWSEKWKPKGWNKLDFLEFNRGEPDVVYMTLDRAALEAPVEQDAEVTVAAQDERGRIVFTNAGSPNRKFNIELFAKADLSTFLHEGGHYFLEVWGDLIDDVRAIPEAERTASQRKALADYETALTWMGVTSRDQLGTAQHEQWAEGMEAYLREGRAPSKSLGNAFSRFRSWLVSIYGAVKPIGAPISDDIRGVFDRLLATDAAIEEVESETGVEPLFTDQTTAGMTDAEWTAYRTVMQDASDEAREALQAKLLRQENRQRQAWWRTARAAVRAVVAAEVNQQPVYQALAAIQRGEHPDGTPLGDGTPMKLSKAELLGLVGKEALATLPKPWVYTTNEDVAVPADVVAERFGFSSGAEMVEAFQGLPTRTRAIEAETDRRMIQQHGDALLDGTLGEAAQEAVYGEQRSKVVQAELKALTKAQQGTVPSAAALRADARAFLATQRVSAVSAGRYLVAAQRASQKAAKLLLEGGSRTEAIQAKQDELVALARYREARDARQRVDTHVAWVKAHNTTKARARFAKAGEAYLEQWDGFLDRYEFEVVPLAKLQRRKSLDAFVKGLEAAGEPVNIAEDVVEDSRRINYKELTLEEFDGVRDAMRQLNHLSVQKNKLLKSATQRDLDAEASVVAEPAEEEPRRLLCRHSEAQLARATDGRGPGRRRGLGGVHPAGERSGRP
jgi:hypothetical protein